MWKWKLKFLLALLAVLAFVALSFTFIREERPTGAISFERSQTIDGVKYSVSAEVAIFDTLTYNVVAKGDIATMEHVPLPAGRYEIWTRNPSCSMTPDSFGFVQCIFHGSSFVVRPGEHTFVPMRFTFTYGHARDDIEVVLSKDRPSAVRYMQMHPHELCGDKAPACPPGKTCLILNNGEPACYMPCKANADCSQKGQKCIPVAESHQIGMQATLVDLPHYCFNN